MRLSRAFVVVLILHIVAVGGIFLFNSMKARNDVASPTAYMEDKTPAAADSGAEAQKAPATPARIHVVTASDTLSNISRQYGIPLSSLIEANNLNAQGGIRVGQRLVIPPKGEPAPVPQLAEVRAVSAPVAASKVNAPAPASTQAASASKAPAAAVEAIPSSGTYTVVKGDNPVAIARKFGVNYQELLEINSIEDPTKLQIGQVLKLPAKK